MVYQFLGVTLKSWSTPKSWLTPGENLFKRKNKWFTAREQGAEYPFAGRNTQHMLYPSKFWIEKNTKYIDMNWMKLPFWCIAIAVTSLLWNRHRVVFDSFTFKPDFTSQFVAYITLTSINSPISSLFLSHTRRNWI